MHTNVHTLACLWAVRMDSVACQEHSVLLGIFGADSLSNSIGRPPVAVFVVKLVRRQNLRCCVEEIFWSYFEAINLELM